MSWFPICRWLHQLHEIEFGKSFPRLSMAKETSDGSELRWKCFNTPQAFLERYYKSANSKQQQNYQDRQWGVQGD